MLKSDRGTVRVPVEILNRPGVLFSRTCPVVGCGQPIAAHQWFEVTRADRPAIRCSLKG